ncbi:MAG: hypothetical protein ACI93R_004127 [Flavobacteriales bacterium]|jgi:hypothetical protein
MFKLLVGLVSLALMSTAVADQGRVYSKSDVVELSTGNYEYAGKSKLYRTNDKICVSATIPNAPTGAYTAWVTIYNEPLTCDASDNGDEILGGQCIFWDAFNPTSRSTMMWLDGSLAGDKNVVRFDRCLAVNTVSHEVFGFGTQEGVVNPMTAEVQLTIRHHGPMQLDNAYILGTQLNSFAGGCSGVIEDFDCADMFAVKHSAVNIVD